MQGVTAAIRAVKLKDAFGQLDPENFDLPIGGGGGPITVLSDGKGAANPIADLQCKKG